MSSHELLPGTSVIVYLNGPREKIWGVLLSMMPAGITLRGCDLEVFDEWMHQEARAEQTGLGLSTLFYPMHRVERLERDETLGPIESLADRFRRHVGRTVHEAAGIRPPES
jgi:hypothetical protein